MSGRLCRWCDCWFVLLVFEVEAPVSGAGGLGVLVVLPVDLPVVVLAYEDADESEFDCRVLDG